MTNRSVPHAGLVTAQLPDIATVQWVPDGAPEAFADAVIGRAPIGPLELDLTLCPGFDLLHEGERAWALQHAPRRSREFVAGRVALRAALARAGWDGVTPLLPSDQGRPGLPAGFTGSVTHKDGQALAIARRLDGSRTLGIDSEVVGLRERSAIARKVLTDQELARWERTRSWPLLLESFSLKEAIYKALHPHVPRYIAFHEADIAPDGGITMTLAQGEGPYCLVGWCWWEGAVGAHRRLVSICEARPG